MCYLQNEAPMRNGVFVCQYGCPESGTEFSFKQVGKCAKDIWVDKMR